MVDAEVIQESFAAAKQPGGTTCPVCRKHMQVYNRKFNAGMARSLIHMHNANLSYPGYWLEVGNYCAKVHDFISGEHAKLVWWGLAEKKPQPKIVKSGAKSEGRYRITEKGIFFVNNRLRIPSHAHEYMSEVLGWSATEINIREALGKKFNYEELMFSLPQEIENE